MLRPNPRRTSAWTYIFRSRYEWHEFLPSATVSPTYWGLQGVQPISIPSIMAVAPDRKLGRYLKLALRGSKKLPEVTGSMREIESGTTGRLSSRCGRSRPRRATMNIFDFRHRLIDDYAGYTRSFIQIRDPQIGEYVGSQLEAGVLWPDPLIQLNPSFEPGSTIRSTGWRRRPSSRVQSGLSY